jgi:hypothetical protein
VATTPPVEVRPVEPAVVAMPEGPADTAPSAGEAGGRRAGRAELLRGGPALALALLLLSAVPLTLSRLLSFETSSPYTADSFTESTGAWTGFVVLPLVAAVALLAARTRLGWALPLASGLVLGTGLVLVEHAVFWVFYFIENWSSYNVGAALWLLVLGAAVVVAAAVVLVRSALAGRAPVRTDWRIASALVVVGSVLWYLVAGPESDYPAWWVALYEGTLLLGGAALTVTLLWLDSAQRIAALVGITIFGLWSVYWIVREIQTNALGIELSVSQTALTGVVLMVVACYVAQIGPARQPSATPTTSR